MHKKIVLGITGSIAAFKAIDILRQLKEQGAEIKVILTEGGKAFVAPLTLQTLSGHRVYESQFDPEISMAHIDLARWADLVLIAPASAHCIAKLAHGFADDLLTTVCLGTKAPIWLAPAMNSVMWDNISTQNNIRSLKEKNIHIINPSIGLQACGEFGEGRMQEPNVIVDGLNQFFAQNQFLLGKRILITAGPTREFIDPVRYLSNQSSGKMGYALANAAKMAGAEVILISGPTSLTKPSDVKMVDVTSAEEMYQATMNHIGDSNIFIAAAAVADYSPIEKASQKIKKVFDITTLELRKNIDIVAEAGKLKSKPFIVGFAAETENVIENATQKRLVKGIDMIIANKVGDGVGFYVDENEVTVISESSTISLPKAPKTALAQTLMEIIGETYSGVLTKHAGELSTNLKSDYTSCKLPLKLNNLKKSA